MADEIPKTLSDGIRWNSKYIFCSVLRFLVCIVVYVMHKFSSLFESLSDYLKKMAEEDSAEKTIKNRCNAFSLTNHINKNDKHKEVNKVIGVTTNELIDSVTKERDAYCISNLINKNEVQEDTNKVISDALNELIDIVTKDHNKQNEEYCIRVDEVMSISDSELINRECNGQSVLEHNIVANLVNCPFNKELQSQIHGGSKKNSDFEVSKEKVEEKINTHKEIGAVGDEKKIFKKIFKNTAMFLITKTLKENELKDRKKIEINLNKDKSLNKGTPIGNSYRGKDRHFTNKTDVFKSEKKSLVKKGHEKTDSIKVVDNSYNKDTSIVSAVNDTNYSDNLDIRENKNPTNENEKLTTENHDDHWESYDDYQNRLPITATENVITTNYGNYWKDYEDDEKIKMITNTEKIIKKNNAKCEESYENRKPISKTENIMINKNNVENWDKNDCYENRKSITKTENMNTPNKVEHWEKYDRREYKKPTTKTEKTLKLCEVKDDIFGLPSTFSLAHCVSNDFHNSMGLTADFKYKYGNIGTLMDQNLHLGDVGHIIHNGQHVFYLVVNRRMVVKPLISSLEIALYKLRDKMNDHKLTKLAIPKRGFEMFAMTDVKKLISKVFVFPKFEITVCLTSSKLKPSHGHSIPKVNFTYKQLWEMEKQTDIIIFINMNDMYSKHWNDIVVENIDAKYPFKERLLHDIEVKPVTAGDLRIYKIDTEVLFCIFTTDKHPLHFTCLEKAFQTMKSEFTGYRYLGVQQERLAYRSRGHSLSRNLLLMKEVFTSRNAEIWICGDTDKHKEFQYLQYKKIVNDAIEMNQKQNLKLITKTRIKLERNKYSTNDVNSKHGLTEKHYCKNTTDENAMAYLVQEQISFNNYITENWDDN